MTFLPILSTPPTKTCLLSSPRAKNHQKSGEPPTKLINKQWKTWPNFKNRIFRADNFILAIYSCSMKRKLEILVCVNSIPLFFSFSIGSSHYICLTSTLFGLIWIMIRPDPGFSEILPTLMSCISELSEYFFKIRKVLKISMSKL